MFRVGGVLSAIVGFALFGSVTFLPLYFQTVDAASPSESGLRMIPMMAGILITSIASGQAIAQLGRYKVFPVVGTAVMAVGLLLLSRLGVGTSTALASLYLFVLGARPRPRHAGARARGPERRPLRDARHGDVRRHAAARDGRLARHRGVRRDLHRTS